MGVLRLTAPQRLPEVSHRVHVESGVDQELHGVDEGEDERLLGIHQRRVGMLDLVITLSVRSHVDSLQLLGEATVESVEDVDEHVGDEVQRLVVVLLDGHFQVEAGELAQVAVRVAVLCAEHGTHLEHALEVGTGGAHLLVELRRLG